MNKVQVRKNKIISPHGGHLIQMFSDELTIHEYKELPIIEVDEKTQSDIIQMSIGTYSPVERFMNLDEVLTVLNDNKLFNGCCWTLPIIMQIDEKKKKRLPEKGLIVIKNEVTKNIIGLLNIESIERIEIFNTIAEKWFLTRSNKHPGVSTVQKKGNYLISGKPILRSDTTIEREIGLTPKIVRNLLHEKNWTNVIGFHTRNIPHRGHEYIQKKALTENDADAIFISPVCGDKKKGDFQSQIILELYTKLIDMGYYEPYGSLLCPLNTYSRYSGPREAVFTAICRKNYGCNYFIVGRDHTGVDNFYKPNDSQEFFGNIDIDMRILMFDPVYYDPDHDSITDDIEYMKTKGEFVNISGSIIRRSILEGLNLSDKIIRGQFLNYCLEKYNNCSSSVFV